MKTLLRVCLLAVLAVGVYVGVASNASAMHVPSPVPIPQDGGTTR